MIDGMRFLQRLVVSLLVTLLICTSGEAPARRLTTSTECRSGLDNMLRDPNWLVVNTSMTRWCRLRAENEMANCCKVADFSRGYAEDCTDCMANCLHKQMQDLCVQQFNGLACEVHRKPFIRTGAPDMVVMETFCVPEDCNNNADKEAIVQWYDALYKKRRGGWHFSYDEFTLICPNGVFIAILWTILVILIIICLIPCALYLFKAPKERGRTLISQADMQTESAADDAPDATLRSAGGGQDALGNTGMGSTR